MNADARPQRQNRTAYRTPGQEGARGRAVSLRARIRLGPAVHGVSAAGRRRRGRMVEPVSRHHACPAGIRISGRTAPRRFGPRTLPGVLAQPGAFVARRPGGSRRHTGAAADDYPVRTQFEKAGAGSRALQPNEPSARSAAPECGGAGGSRAIAATISLGGLRRGAGQTGCLAGPAAGRGAPGAGPGCP